MHMVLLIVGVIYIGIVLGTYLKFDDNGLRFAGRSYLFLVFLPLILLYIHIVVIVKYVIDEKKMPLILLIFPLIKLPLIIGLFIEVILERQAQAVASRSNESVKTRRYDKRNTSINSEMEKVELDFKLIKTTASHFKNKLLPREAV